MSKDHVNMLELCRRGMCCSHNQSPRSISSFSLYACAVFLNGNFLCLFSQASYSFQDVFTKEAEGCECVCFELAASCNVIVESVLAGLFRVILPSYS